MFRRNKSLPCCYLLHAGFVLGLFFDPEDGGMFLGNVDWFSMDYKALYPKR
jgi:hypothetical protein